MLFGYALDKQGNEVHYRNCFFHIGINARGGDNRAAEILADIFYNHIGVTEVWLCVDIKVVFIFFVNDSLCFFKEGPMRSSSSFKNAVWKALRR